MVTNEEHIADQGIETITEPNLLLVGNVLEESLHLLLRVHLWLHLITLIVQAVEILLLHLVGTLMEHTIQHPVGDERTSETILLEVQAVRLDFL